MSTLPTEAAPVRDRAIRLFRFLMHAQESRDEPVRTVDSYGRDGAVVWFDDLPRHPAVRTALEDDQPEAGQPCLVVDRLSRLAPPPTGDELDPWVDGVRDDTSAPPTLRPSITIAGEPDQFGDPVARIVTQDDRPGIAESFARWLERWSVWAEREQHDAEVRGLYGELFAMYVDARGRAEELELVLGVGCLSWTPPDHPAVFRHLLTGPVTVEFDEDSGRLTVSMAEAVEAAAVEVDMLDASLITQAKLINDTREDAGTFVGHLLDSSEAGGLVRRVVHVLAPDADYRDDVRRPVPADHPVCAFAPALVLRKRARKGFVEIFRTIIGQLSDGSPVPEGVLPLVDPAYEPTIQTDAGAGAVVLVDGDAFLPMPVNERQLQILRRVDTHAQTLVQGPPGTGKTHTAAALVSHLLAQGKRVLITAHTDRALKEVRAKLPKEIQPLAVSVVGSSREELAELRTSVERIGSAAAETDPVGTERAVRRALDTITDLGRARTSLQEEMVASREDAVREHAIGRYTGTLAQVARAVDLDADRLGWLAEHIEPIDVEPPASDAEVLEWHGLLADADLAADEAEARGRVLDPATLPGPHEFADLAAAEAEAAAADRRVGHLRAHPGWDSLRLLPAQERADLRARITGLRQELSYLSGRREQWIHAALADLHDHRGDLWLGRLQQISILLERAGPYVRRLDAVTTVDVRGEGDPAALVPAARELQSHLTAGNSVKTGPDGRPRAGPFTAGPVKRAAPLFEAVRVDGLPPTTAERVEVFLDWVEATKTLDALDRAWPATTMVPREDTVHERLQWHATETALLHRVAGLAVELRREEARLGGLRVPAPRWNDDAEVGGYLALLEAVAVAERLARASAPVEEARRLLAAESRWGDAAPAVRAALSAVEARDHELYATSLRRLGRLRTARELLTRRDDLDATLRASAPRLHAAVSVDVHNPLWPQRLSGFDAAWAWAYTRATLRRRHTADVNRLQRDLDRIEERIRAQVETLAATRAWAHAVAPGRLDRSARASLEHYAYLVKQLGKGSGKFGAQRRADVRQAMGQCRSAVPVWILPTYRIAEQLTIEPNMFDVVVVDEASQAGVEATFLQYLAPRIVVIGDDKQVSPAAVGVDQQHLRDLANQYLYDDDFRSAWQDPKRSLFDEAKMRFAGMLTLTEHRRCVPEIIEFSNRIAYEPEGVRLVPVRQFGSDRLPPIVPVHVPDGVQEGSTKVNRAEAVAIVDQIEECCADPRYDGLTFGVISLLGTGQAKLIEKLLQERVAEEEWVRREIRCGDAADFQGSERDVMFLSMVAAPAPGKRTVALTADTYVQRYNVAASRAKDQMWLFHSIPAASLGNTEDMRFRLLDYCYTAQHNADEDDRVLAQPLTDDEQAEPFDSLFTQRVANRLLDRGFAVIPKFETQGRLLDLVVIGGTARLAVQCEGDSWEGAEAYRRDLDRQRELQRCGWTIVRVREADFTLDPTTTLEPVWTSLSALGITSADGLRAASGSDAAAPADPVAPAVPVGPLSEPRGGVTVTPPPTPADRPSDPGPPDTIQEWSDADDEPPSDASATSDVDARSAPGAELPPYIGYDGTVVPAALAQPDEIIDGLLAIVAVEGPILGHRLHSVYVQSSDGMRVGHQIAQSLNSAISSAVRRGRLVREDPLGEAGVRPTTLRLPEQPPVLMRQLGPRRFEHIPPSELAAVMHDAGQQVGWDDELVFRATLRRYGIQRMGSAIRNRLYAVLPLAQEIREQENGD